MSHQISALVEVATLNRGSSEKKRLYSIIYTALERDNANDICSGTGISDAFSKTDIEEALAFIKAHPYKDELAREIKFLETCLTHIKTKDDLITIYFG